MRNIVPLRLALKEVWRSKTKFLLISGVVALLTTLVLFISGLNEGLAVANRQYIENIQADLLVYQADVNLSVTGSRLGWTDLRDVRRIDGVKAVGSIGLSRVTLALDGVSPDPFIVNMLGVEPGKPGMPPLKQGQPLLSKRANEVVIDENVARQTGLTVGEILPIKSLTGTEEELYDMRVVGIAPSQFYFIQASIFVPSQTWQDVKPKTEAFDPTGDILFNIIAVQLEQPERLAVMAKRLEEIVGDVEVVDRRTAYEATPGYLAQINVLNTQQFFMLVIGTLVIGGFFQIQTLQRVAQVGMFKAIGASNAFIVTMTLAQIIVINVIGVMVGSLGALALAQVVPTGAPILFEGRVVVSALALLLLIGPLSGLLSVWTLFKVEPLTALGLAS